MSGPNGEGGPYVALSAGGAQTCAIKAGGVLKCWGNDASGQVSGPNDDKGTFLAVSAGGLHTCGIHSGGSLTCWGDDTFGQVSGPNGAPYR